MSSFAERFVRVNIIRRFWTSLHMVVGLFGSFIMLTALSVYEFGLYQLVLAAVSLTTIFSADIFDEVVQNDISRALGEKQTGVAKRLFHELAALKIGLGVLASLVLFLAANLVAGVYHQDIGSYVRIASILVVLYAVRSTANIFLRSVVSSKSMGASVIEDVVKLGFVSTFFAFGQLSVYWVLIATLLGASAALLYICIGFLREYAEVFRGVKGASRWLFKDTVRTYGKWILFRAVIKRTAKPVRPWLIVTLLNAEAVALYTLASNLVTMLKDFFPSAGSSLLALEVGDFSRMRRIFSRGIKYSFIYGAFMAAAAVVAVPWLVSFFLPKYLPAVPLFFVFLVSVPLHGIQTLETEILVALREQKVLTARLLTEIVIGSGLIIALAPIIGVFATGIGPVAAISWRTWFLYKQIVRKYPGLRPDRHSLLMFDDEDLRIAKRAVLEARALFMRQPKSGTDGMKT